MSPDELAKLIEDIISAADTNYTAAMIKLQASLYDDLLVTMKRLETDQDGYIIQNSGNRSVLDDLEGKVRDAYGGRSFQVIVSKYVSSITKIEDGNQQYFSGISSSFKPTRIFLNNLQKGAIDTVENIVLGDGLQSQVVNPLLDILNQNVNAGGKYPGFLEQVRSYVLGNEKVDPRALSYSRVYLNNILFQYARSYQQGVTADLGLEWYLYSGDVMDKSREFCVARAGKYFNQSEIESWANLQWKGKDPLTTESSIFILCGGFSCKHQLIPVHETLVPADDKSRVVEKAL